MTTRAETEPATPLAKASANGSAIPAPTASEAPVIEQAAKSVTRKDRSITIVTAILASAMGGVGTFYGVKQLAHANETRIEYVESVQNDAKSERKELGAEIKVMNARIGTIEAEQRVQGTKLDSIKDGLDDLREDLRERRRRRPRRRDGDP